MCFCGNICALITKANYPFDGTSLWKRFCLEVCDLSIVSHCFMYVMALDTLNGQLFGIGLSLSLLYSIRLIALSIYSTGYQKLRIRINVFGARNAIAHVG